MEVPFDLGDMFDVFYRESTNADILTFKAFNGSQIISINNFESCFSVYLT